MATVRKGETCVRRFCESEAAGVAPTFRATSSKSCVRCQDKNRKDAAQRRHDLNVDGARAVVPPDEALRMADRYRAGESIDDLAHAFKRGRTTVYRTLRRQNVAMRDPRRPHKGKLGLTFRVARLETAVHDLMAMLDTLDARTRKLVTASVPAHGQRRPEPAFRTEAA